MPYAYDALEPHIDARTMEIHHTKHHQKYTDGMNGALEKFDKEAKSNMYQMNNYSKILYTNFKKLI